MCCERSEKAEGICESRIKRGCYELLMCGTRLLWRYRLNKDDSSSKCVVQKVKSIMINKW